MEVGPGGALEKGPTVPRSGRAMPIFRSFALAAVFGVVVPIACAHAASFDCGKAASEREHLICADPRLSSRDTELGRVYAAKRAVLSPAGALLLQQSARSWFSFTQTVCGLRPHTQPNPAGIRPTECLNAAYVGRLEALAHVGRFGPFVFNRVDVYGVKPVTNANDSSGTAPGFYVTHIAYPQIDAASKATENAWNSKAAVFAEDFNRGVSEDCCDEDTDYELGLVTRRLISTRWRSWDRPHGAAHGLYVQRVWNALLDRRLRDLAPADLFGSDEKWSQRLGAIALRTIEGHGWKPGPPDAEAEVRGSATNPKDWFLRREGLDVSFSAYVGGCYMCTPQNGLVAWSKLRPIMTGTAPVP